MGETQNQPFQVSFKASLKVAFQGSKVTSNGGLIQLGKLDERRGFGKLMDRHPTDAWAENARFSFADLLQQSDHRRMAGYEDVNDTDQLSSDSTFRLIGSEEKIGASFRGLYSQVGFIVTNLTLPSRAVVRFYNKRGDGRVVDHRRQTGSEDDAAQSPQVSI